MNVVYIAGMGHSGSTLLNLILGEFEKTISVGEIDKIIYPGSRELFLNRYIYKEKYSCSCGEKPGSCPFWSAFIEILEKNKKEPYDWTYLKAMETAKQLFGVTHFVDASKNIHALKRVTTAVNSSEEFHLKVLHLVKDVRNQTVSNMRGKREKGIMRNYRKWLRQNSQLDDWLQSENIPHLHVGYEELAISTTFIVNKISKFLDLPEKHLHRKINPSESHILVGNNMRLNKEKSSKIEYDYQWFTNSEVPLLYKLYPGLHQQNMKWCYNNIQEKFKK